MVRTILTPDNAHINVGIPDEYIGKQVEVTVLALEELEDKREAKTMGDFWGILSHETAEGLREHLKNIRDEWERDI